MRRVEVDDFFDRVPAHFAKLFGAVEHDALHSRTVVTAGDVVRALDCSPRFDAVGQIGFPSIPALQYSRFGVAVFSGGCPRRA